MFCFGIFCLASFHLRGGCFCFERGKVEWVGGGKDLRGVIEGENRIKLYCLKRILNKKEEKACFDFMVFHGLSDGAIVNDVVG